MTTQAMKNVEKAFRSHGKSLDENGNEIKSPETKNVDRGFEKGASPESTKEDAQEGIAHPGRSQQERFGDQYRKVSSLDCPKTVYYAVYSATQRPH